MPLEQMLAWVLGSATMGAILKSFVDWLLARGDKRVSREDAIAKANDELGANLREELRRDYTTLRAEMAAAEQTWRLRMREADNRTAELSGQIDQLTKVNTELRRENMTLQKENGEATGRMNELARQNTDQARIIADQALKLSTFENDLATAYDRIAVLETALRGAHIDVPAAARRRGDTGPLGKTGA